MLFLPVIEKGIDQSPVFKHPNPGVVGALRSFTSHPSSSLLFLAARRNPPVLAPAPNTDHSIGILTSVGFSNLNIVDYISSASSLRPDVVIGIPDIPSHVPGKTRIPKMAHRTERWLEALLKDCLQARLPVFAPVLPIPTDEQQLYHETLVERLDELGGLALYDSSLTDIPKALRAVPWLALDEPQHPHAVLKAIAAGIDLFHLPFISAATDAGIALDFNFGPSLITTEYANPKKPMGHNLWDPIFAADLNPLVEKCTCHSCLRHHRAYISHLLSAKEMTAWVLLQIHNTHVVDTFFAAVRNSIEYGRFERDVEVFSEGYEDILPAETGEGPRYGFCFLSSGMAVLTFAVLG
jgi:queuine tRNA-ribosyltransferase subunit QTRTD1